jgi:hypothetical protein
VNARLLAPAVALGAVFIVALVAGFILFLGDDDEGGAEPVATPTPTPEPQTTGAIETVLATHAQTTQGKAFVPDCAAANPMADVDKICATARGERENMRAFVLGLTFSEGIEWVILTEAAGQWTVTDVIPLTADNAGVPGVPWPLRTGVDVVVIGAAPDCLNVRTSPEVLPDNAVDAICDGTVIQLSAGPVEADNYTWWQVSGRDGWIVGDYLRYPDDVEDEVDIPQGEGGQPN